MLEHFRRFSVLALVDQELWRFLEVEHHESKEEGKQRDCTSSLRGQRTMAVLGRYVAY